jgi:enoyl-[acyl-carrier-protein] reductase (NADH)
MKTPMTQHDPRTSKLLQPRGLMSKKGLVVSVANGHGIAYGCAQSMRAHGASLAATSMPPTT